LITSKFVFHLDRVQLTNTIQRVCLNSLGNLPNLLFINLVKHGRATIHVNEDLFFLFSFNIEVIVAFAKIIILVPFKVLVDFAHGLVLGHFQAGNLSYRAKILLTHLEVLLN
jgi:hypothetical protein